MQGISRQLSASEIDSILPPIPFSRLHCSLMRTFRPLVSPSWSIFSLQWMFHHGHWGGYNAACSATFFIGNPAWLPGSSAAQRVFPANGQPRMGDLLQSLK